MEEKNKLLYLLKELSPEEINKIIEQKGKKPKLTNAFIKVKR